jgi:glutaredoxin
MQDTNKQTKKVEIFSTPQCHFCHMAKDWFNLNKIEFSDYDVTQDFARRQELIHLGAMGVPLIRITGEGLAEPIIVNGFDVDHLKEVLGVK